MKLYNTYILGFILLISFSNATTYSYKPGDINNNSVQLTGEDYITGDDGVDYFFHQSMLTEDVNIRDEDKVEFKVVDGDRGKQASDVSLVD